jgi:hypothetical protein
MPHDNESEVACSEIDSESESNFSLCDSNDGDVFYILIIIGLIIAAILVLSNFVYWLATLFKFGFSDLPVYLKSLAVTGWLVPPLGILFNIGAEMEASKR